MRHVLKKHLPDHDTIRRNPWLRPFANTLLHPRLWHLNRRSAAGAMAAGLFCGLIPGPLQMPSAAVCAVIFRVNLPLSMFVTLYTNPLTLVPLYLLAYQLGRLLTDDGSGFVAPPDFSAGEFAQWLNAMQSWMAAVALPLGVGLFVLAGALSIAGYFLTRGAWRLYLVRAWRRRQAARQAR